MGKTVKNFMLLTTFLLLTALDHFQRRVCCVHSGVELLRRERCVFVLARYMMVKMVAKMVAKIKMGSRPGGREGETKRKYVRE